jgi:hypothetical protein
MPKKKVNEKVKKGEVTDKPRDISEEDVERLRSLAKGNKKTPEDILEEWDVEYKNLTDAGITANVGRLAVNAVMNNYRRIKLKDKPLPGRKKKETVTVMGFISGDMGIWDKADQVRRTVKAFINKKGIKAAQEAQMVDGENHILDQREKLYGRINPNHLKPLDPNLHVLDRTLFGFFKHNGDKNFKYGSIQTSDNRLARGWSKVKTYTPCQVTAIVREEIAEDIKLGSSSAEESMSVFKALKEDWDIRKIIDDTLSKHEIEFNDEAVTIEDQWTPIKDVEKHHEAFKDAWDRRIFVKGVVAWINTDRPTPFGAVWMGLMNPDNEDELVRVLIPEQISVDFGELSEVYVFGKTKRSKYKNQEAAENAPDSEKYLDGDVVVNATGIYPVVPTPKDSSSVEGGADEKEIEGWLD